MAPLKVKVGLRQFVTEKCPSGVFVRTIHYQTRVVNSKHIYMHAS
jgi:hypothetical protein